MQKTSSNIFTIEVTNTVGKPIKNAVISIQDSQSQLDIAALTDENGQFIVKEKFTKQISIYITKDEYQSLAKIISIPSQDVVVRIILTKLN